MKRRDSIFDRLGIKGKAVYQPTNAQPWRAQ
jgi:hypothetical protein